MTSLVMRARYLTARAIRLGELVRPKACSWCGDEPGHDRRGAPLIQAHHAAYDRPLDVEWICISCHRGHHGCPPRLGGPRPVHSKLSVRERREKRLAEARDRLASTRPAERTAA